ncbi:MAG: hypothetical protein ACP5JJ_04795 [Anaerolineae bacterium]
MRYSGDVIVVGKNRKRAFWALLIVGFMTLVSIALLLAGIMGGQEIRWGPIWLGTIGLLGFGVSAALVIRTMRSPWHLAVSPGSLQIHTQAYVLEIPWKQIAGIAVDEVNFRDGCVLLFEDPAAVVAEARFLVRSNHPDVVTDQETMLARMAENYRDLGYHFGIPGRILELGPEELAQFLAKARTGSLWES